MLTEGWIITFGLLLAIGLATRQGSLVAIGTLVVLAGAVAWAWNRLSLTKVTYERSLSESKAFIGEEVQLTLRLTNKKPVPLTRLELTDSFPEDLPLEGIKVYPSYRAHTVNFRKSVSIGWYERITWKYQIRCTTRGYHTLGPAVLDSGDVFGFHRSTREEETVEHLTVYPRIVPLPQVRLPAQRPFGEVRGGEPIYEDPSRIMGLREFRYNDPLKRVDWKATSKRQALQVKVYEPSVSLNLLILLNLATVGSVWEGYDPILLERAVTAAASVAQKGIQDRFTVGLLANGASLAANRPLKVQASRDPRQLTAILEALAMVGPFYTASIEEVIQREGRLFPFGSTILLVTAMMTEPLAGALLHLREEGHPVVVLSVADQKFQEDLRGMPVYELGAYFKNLEVMGFAVEG